MNRREAIAALTSLPGLASITKAELRPHDVLVVECEGFVSLEQIHQIKETLKQIWPDNRSIVLDGRTKLRVMAGD